MSTCRFLAAAALLGLLGSSCPQAPLVPGDTNGNGSTPVLLATLHLTDTRPSLHRLALDTAARRAFVSDGPDVRAIDLDQRAWWQVQLASGAFYAIDDEDDLWAVISPDTGRIVSYRSYPVSADPPSGFATGLTCDPSTGTLLVIDIYAQGRAAAIFEINPQDGSLVQRGSLGLGIGLSEVYSLARDPQTGLLYTVDVYDRLFRIDPTTWQAAWVGDLPTEYDNIQGLACSAGGLLYGIHSLAPSVLVRLDPASAAATRIGDLPLGRTFGSLASKPDGTLWAVDLTLDEMLQIDPASASVVQTFDPLPVPKPSGDGVYFDGIDALDFCPNSLDIEPVAAMEDDVRGMAAAGNGEVLLTTMGRANHFGQDMLPSAGPVRFSKPLTDPQDLVAHPSNGRIYARDNLKGKVYEFDSAGVLRREMAYREPRHEATSTYSEHTGVDSQTGRLFVQDSDGVYVVDLAEGDLTMAERVSTVPFNQTVEGLVVDAARRRLYLSTLNQGPGTAIRSLDLDTYQELASIAMGNQMYHMALDAQRNRLAVNTRVTTGFDSTVILLDLGDLSVIDFDLTITDGGALEVDLAIDTTANQLLVTRYDGGDPRVEIYALPD